MTQALIWGLRLSRYSTFSYSWTLLNMPFYASLMLYGSMHVKRGWSVLITVAIVSLTTAMLALYLDEVVLWAVPWTFFVPIILWCVWLICAAMVKSQQQDVKG
jgi:hypothetical protein